MEFSSAGSGRIYNPTPTKESKSVSKQPYLLFSPKMMIIAFMIELFLTQEDAVFDPDTSASG